MTPTEDGMWRVTVGDAGPGTDYAFLLGDDDTPLPDPRSRWQPAGVHGPSRLHDPQAYEWKDEAWTGRQLAGSVLYELHIGTFTPEGTFAAAVDRLDHLAALGVDLIGPDRIVRTETYVEGGKRNTETLIFDRVRP